MAEAIAALPQPGDRVLLEHRYSAFDHTALDLLLGCYAEDVGGTHVRR